MAANLDALGHGSGSWLSCIKHRFRNVSEAYLSGVVYYETERIGN